MSSGRHARKPLGFRARLRTRRILGLIAVLTVLFVVLELTGALHWSWWYVLAPLWIPGAAVTGMTVVWITYGVFDHFRASREL